ncbi:MAG: glycoside hydrolase family 25 protein [Lachnospiraceae bacterium]|nr:glycoside hydrolase family 25 protein [Lachnospiraceae bacterium]
MQKKRIRTLHTIIVLLTVVTIISLTFAGAMGALYVRAVGENSRLRGEQPRADDILPALSVDVENTAPENTEPGMPNQDTAASAGASGTAAAGQAGTGELDEAGIAALMQSKEAEVEQSIKDRMKALVTGEDGSPLRMLRSFFPENLIYSFEEEYVFAPVLEGVKKHSLLEENFEKTEEGLMQYVENGTVTSHKGIDVSKYQGAIDWAKVKAEGIEYAFIRLGLRGYESGKLVLDEFYDDNMKGANSAGVGAGVYFFTQAVTVEEAKEEAAFVIQNLANYDVSCPVVFDVERIAGGKGRADILTQEQRTDITIAFCEAVKAAGYTPMIYGNVVCFTQMLDMTRLNDYEKWYAFYDDYMYMPYDVSCWQYTEKGRVDGIANNVDLNISFKTW